MTELKRILGRDDILWVSNTGEVTTFINQRGSDLSLSPSWLEAGVTHSGIGTNVTDRSQVVFGSVSNQSYYTAWPLYQGVGADYSVAITSDTPVGTRPYQTYLSLNLWANSPPGGGTRQKGDGARYCDMRGTGSGNASHSKYSSTQLTNSR